MATKLIDVDGDRILILFPYSLGMLARVKEGLPDAKWDKDKKYWWLPATQFHADIARKFGTEYDYVIGPNVSRLANTPKGKQVSKLQVMKGKLYPHQAEAVLFGMKAGGKFILADEMGLGKTIEALAYLTENNVTKALIVSPASVVYKWEAETLKWTDKTVQVLSTGKTKMDPDVNYYIVSYNGLTSRVTALTDAGIDAVIFDECHYLANDSQRTNAARFLAPSCSTIIGLSGTPFLNKPIEMFYMLNMIDPAAFSDRWRYARRYCDLKETPFGWDMSGSSHEDELKDRMKYVLLRRTKELLKDMLPELTRSVYKLDVDKKSYSKIMKEARQLKDHKQGLQLVRRYCGEVKVLPTLSLLEDIMADPAQKVVVYAHYKLVVQYLAQEISKKYSTKLIVGDTSKEDRALTIAQFQNDPHPQVLIISEAGGEGIDLFRARNIIFTERAWNPGKEAQAEARLHRIGQKNVVTAHYLVLKDTIDERVHNMIEAKRSTFDKIIGLDAVETSIEEELLSEFLKE